MWQVQVEVMPKKGILDPEGTTVLEALLSLGYKGVSHMRIGKNMRFFIDGSSKEEVEEKVKRMCDNLLANPVIEDYMYSIQWKDDGG